MRMNRSRALGPTGVRPVMLAVAGDSGSGKTTLTRGLVEAIGAERCTSICVDDYHRYDRAERRAMAITPLSPQANYIDIMEQQLQMLAMGQPVLKPVYDHATGTITRPEYVEPTEFVIVEGLLPLFTKLSRACFDISVYLDPPEPLRRAWKMTRDTTERGYTAEEVARELALREPDSAAYIRPQQHNADIVVRFAPVSDDDTGGTGGTSTSTVGSEPLSAEILLRPTIQHPPLSNILTDDVHTAMHLKIIRDADGTPVDALYIHGRAQPAEIQLLKKAIWDGVVDKRAMPSGLGVTSSGQSNEILAVTQLLLLYHLAQEVYQT
jgi:phosphoribulokinase